MPAVRHLLPVLAVVATLCLGACRHKPMTQPGPAPSRDINAVLAANQQRLLAVPGVVGTCVSLMPDGRTPCIKVMLSQATPESARSIPSTLEGYPVIKEVTGEIRPFGQP
jgi:hypothetical protein